MNAKLKTDNGIIEGTYCYLWHQKQQVGVNFTYEGKMYSYPFSRKTGKLYGCKLPFNISLIIDENTKL